MSTNFLFVNKDAASVSLTRSSAAEQSSINSHVQRGRRHRRFAARPRRGNNNIRRTISCNKPDGVRNALSQPGSPASITSAVVSRSTGWHGFVDSPSSGFSPRLATQRPPGRDPRILSEPGTIQAQGHHDLDQVTIQAPGSASESRSNRCQDRAPPSSPRDISQILLNPLEPFAQAAITVDPQITKLCRYFCEVYHPSIWHTERHASPHGRYTFQTAAAEVVRQAMQSEVDMYAMLACMASRMENVDKLEGQGAAEYMQRALAATRQQLHHVTDTRGDFALRLLMIIFHLYAAEAYRKNYQAAKMHMRGAKSIVDSLGGLGKVKDSQMRELIIIGDGNLAAVLLQPCDFPCDFDPGPYWSATSSTLQLSRDQDLDTIASALRYSPTNDFVPAQMKRIIEDVAECVWVLHRAQSAPPEVAIPATRWLTVRSAVMRHRLLQLEFAEEPGLEAFRVALLMWILTTMTLLGLKRLGRLIAPQLRAISQQACSPTRHWKGRVDIMIWVLMVGAMCAAPGSADEKWFVHNMIERGSTRHVEWDMKLQGQSDRVMEVLRRFHQRFFYYDAVQQPRLARLSAFLSVGWTLL